MIPVLPAPFDFFTVLSQSCDEQWNWLPFHGNTQESRDWQDSWKDVSLTMHCTYIPDETIGGDLCYTIASRGTNGIITQDGLWLAG